MTFRPNGGPGSRISSLKIKWDGSKTVAENASEKLPELARAFFAAGREVVAGNASFEALHQFRLLTKRFRYSLELFRPCYGPGLDKRIEALRKLQRYLGEINDCSTTTGLLLDRSDLRKRERDKLVRQLKELAAARMIQFRSYWQENFEESRCELWWTDYLSRFATRKRR